jgi:hypothetical protein
MDPLRQLKSGDRLPRSATAWNKSLSAAKKRRQRQTPPPSGEPVNIDPYPYEIVQIRNAGQTRIDAGTLCNLRHPTPGDNFSVFGYYHSRLQQVPIVWLATPTITAPGASSFCRALETIQPSTVGRAALLGHLPDGISHYGPKRHWAGKKFVGIPFLNQGRHESQPFDSIESNWITVPATSTSGGQLSGVPGPLSKPSSIDGLEILPLRDAGVSRMWAAYRPVHPTWLVATLTIRLLVSRPRVTMRSGYLYGDCDLSVAVNGNPYVPSNPRHFAQHWTVPPIFFNRCIRQFSGTGFDANFNNSPLTSDGANGSVPPQELREFRTFTVPMTLGGPDQLYTGDIYWTVIWKKGRSVCPVLPTVKIAGCMLEFLEIDRDDSRNFAGQPLTPSLGNSSILASSQMGPELVGSGSVGDAQLQGSSGFIANPGSFLRTGTGSLTTGGAVLSGSGSSTGIGGGGV